MTEAVTHVDGIEETDLGEASRGHAGGRWAAIFAVCAGLALFAVAGFVIASRLGGPPPERSAEAGFSRDMSAHHAQAVEMAEIVRQRTTDPEIRTLATDIALTQQGQIGRMQGWLDAWSLPATGLDEPMTWMGHPVEATSLMPGMATGADVASLGTLPTEESDVRFLQLMIPHHQAAIEMARTILDQTDEPAVRSFASNVISSQTAEIQAMEDMLAARGASVPSMEEGPMTSMEDPMASPSPSGSPSHAGSHG